VVERLRNQQTNKRKGNHHRNNMKITLAFDICGTLVDPSGMAKHLAHESAWVQRSEEKIYGPWGIEPNVAVRSLIELPPALHNAS
jgi:hypothetical protein